MKKWSYRLVRRTIGELLQRGKVALAAEYAALACDEFAAAGFQRAAERCEELFTVLTLREVAK